MVSIFYNGISADQIVAVYKLVGLLRRLRVIGTLELSTVGVSPEVLTMGEYDLIDMTMNIYAIEKIAYDPNKGKMLVEELLESIFGKVSQGLRGTF